MTIRIRSAEVGDAEQLGRLHVRAWRAAYSGGLMPDEYLRSLSSTDRAEMWRRILAGPDDARSARLVATLDGSVIGFALAGPARDGDEPDLDGGELYAINVDPDHWGTGAGAALMSAATDALRASEFTSAVLWVHPDNERARRFYGARGWTDDGVERRQEVLGVEVPEVRLSLTLGPNP